MKHKVAPSQTTGKTLHDLINGDFQTEAFLSEIMRRGTEHILQQALEEELTDFLGRDRYERCQTAPPGYRNGYQDKLLKTSQGVLRLRKPRARQTQRPFESRLLERIDTLEQRLVTLTIEMYTRGLSTRDIEETLVDQDGAPLLSRSSVSRLTEALFVEYEDFARGDLSTEDVVYLFVDGVYEAVRHYTNNQVILCAWGITAAGAKVLLHLSCAASESEAAWSGFFEELLGRGLAQPLMVISDGAPAIKAALARHFPKSDRQRCLAHKLRNLSAKLPQHERSTVLAQARAVFYASDTKTAHLLAEHFVAAHAERYPSMVRSFSDDLEACLVHLKYPEGHRKFIRTTNMLERGFEEEKRRTKIIPQHLHERSAVKLVYGVLIRAARRWRRIPMSPVELTQLRYIRKIMCHDSQDSQTLSFRLAA